MRRRVYGRLPQSNGDRKIALMEEIAAEYGEKADADEKATRLNLEG